MVPPHSVAAAEKRVGVAGELQSFCPWVPERSRSNLISEKSQNALARPCVLGRPCLLKKPICCSVLNREEVRPARSKLDELLGRGSVAKILERPGTGECKEFKLDKKYQKQPGEHSQGCWDGPER